MNTTLGVILTLMGGAVALAIGWIVGLKRATDAAVRSIGPTPSQVKEKTDTAAAKAVAEVSKEEEEVRDAPLSQKIDMARALRERGRLRK